MINGLLICHSSEISPITKTLKGLRSGVKKGNNILAFH
jgi:hypothetical protein